MAILNDIEVRVVTKANKQQLTEYDKPNTGAKAEEACVEKYIEAKTGEDFQVDVYFKKGYKCFRAWGVEVTIDIDGGVVNYAYEFSKDDLRGFQDDEDPITFDSVSQREGSLVSDVGFRFGSLNFDENTHSSREVLEAQAEKLGVIKIETGRVNRKRLPKPEETGGFYKPLASVDVSEELIKDKHVSHIMQAGEKTPAEAEEGLEYYDYRYYREKGCGPSFFKFRYRSEMDLRLLGCIPGTLTSDASIIKGGEVSVIPAGIVQTPAADSPDSVAAKAEPSDVVDSSQSKMRDSNSTDAHNSLAEENQQLKQRLKDVEAKQARMLAALMGGLSNAIQSAFPSTRSSLAAPTAGAATPIKRERIKEQDGAGDSGQTAGSGGRAAKRTRTVIELD